MAGAQLAALKGFVEKLAHPLEEVRLRAVRSLRSKIEAGLYQATDLCVEPSLARNLVNLLPIQANTDASQSEALQLLAAVAGHPDMSRQLVSLGALDYLEELQRGGGAIGDGAAAAARMLLSQRVEFDDGRTPPRIVSPSKTTAAPAASRSLQYPPPSTTTVPVVSAATLRALPCPAWMRLRAPALSGRDSQAVFEVSVRLQMAEASVLRDACERAALELAPDLGAAALLRAPELLQGVLALLRTTEPTELSALALHSLDALTAIAARLGSDLRARAADAADAPADGIEIEDAPATDAPRATPAFASTAAAAMAAAGVAGGADGGGTPGVGGVAARRCRIPRERSAAPGGRRGGAGGAAAALSGADALRASALGRRRVRRGGGRAVVRVPRAPRRSPPLPRPAPGRS